MRKDSDAIGGICRILIVDDHGPWRAVAASIVESVPGFQVIAEAADGFEAIQRASALSPDIVLMDLGMPGMNGIESAGRIRELSRSCKIVFFSELRSPDIAKEALRIGGGGYVVKSNSGSELIPALKAVLAGERFISAAIADADLILATIGITKEEQPAAPNPFVDFGQSAVVPEFLASVVHAAKADFGNVRLFDSSNCTLKIVAQSGFPSEFLNNCATIDYMNGCACAAAMRTRVRIIVTEVSSDLVFSNESRNALLGAKIRSLQATPLIGSQERLIGVVSTHYVRPGGPRPEVLPKIDDLTARFLTTISS
jgi:DNA-binding NarL/FixJ family response regulator